MKTKYCPQCDNNLSLSSYNKNASRSDGLQSYCRPCSAAYKVQWRTTTDSWKEYYNVRQRRGMTQVEFDQLLKSQKGVCVICQTDNPGKRSFHLDHDHKTGKNRGILCGNCNRGIGHLQEDVTILNAAIQYIMKHNSV